MHQLYIDSGGGELGILTLQYIEDQYRFLCPEAEGKSRRPIQNRNPFRNSV